MKKIDSRIIVIVIGILATIFFCYPYLNKLNIDGHDLDYHLARIQQIAVQLKEFKIPVLIHPDLADGLGYANSIFYPELFLYIPAIIHLIGIGTITTYKIFIGIITFATYIIMYKTSKTITKKTSISIIASLLYTFSLYRIVDVYTRAALGEILAFTFAPLILLGLYELIYNNEKKWWILPLGIFGIVNSHILTFGIAVIFILLFLVLNIKRIFKDKSRIKYIIISGIISILLTASVFLPIIEQATNNDYKVFSGGTSEQLSEKSLLLTQIFMNEYKDARCKDNTQVNDQMNFGNGILLLALTLFIFIAKWENSNDKNFIWKIFISGIILLIMTSVIFPWQYFKIFNFMQLPWRLNIIITLCFSIVGAYSFYNSVSNKDIIYILAIIIVVTTSGYLDKVTYQDEMASECDSVGIGQEEYLPVNGYNKDDIYVFDMQNKNISYDYEKKQETISFELTKEKNSKYINIPLIYYTGYKAYITNDVRENLDVQMNENGMILLKNEELKTGKVEVKYEMTAIQRISYFVSYGTLIIIMYFWIKNSRKEKNV